MITALNKQTNEVLGFPDGMSQDSIESAIHSDKIGRPDVDINPNTYDTVIRPALKESMAKNDPNILYNARVKQLEVDPFLSTLFNPFGLLKSSNPEIQEEQKLNVQAHPDQAMIGNLTQQVGTISATAGMAGGLIEPIAARLGLLARGMTPMAIRTAAIGSGEVLPKLAGEAIQKTVTSAASAGMIGAFYQGISSSVEQGKGVLDNNQAPDLRKIGESIASGLGWSVYGSGGAFTGKLLGISAASATVGGTAYLMSKMDGASESDARLNGVVMTAFTAVTHGNFTFEARKKLVSDLQDTFAGYTKAKNPDTEQNNIHKLVGDEIVGKSAKELLREKYKSQMDEWNKNFYVKNIRTEADNLRNPQEISNFENEGGGQGQHQPIKRNPVKKKLTPKQIKDYTELQKQINSLENEGGNYAINEVTKTQEDTEELVKRLSDQVLSMENEGSPSVPLNNDEERIFSYKSKDRMKTSKIAKSIENKSRNNDLNLSINSDEQSLEMQSEGSPANKLTKSIEGFDKLAKYRPTTFSEQEKIAKRVLENINESRAIIRGEKDLPENLEGVALISEMEKYLKNNPSEEINYELANSPLVTETSEHARGLSVARMREPDSYAASIAELKSKKLQMNKNTSKEIPRKAKEEMNKINLSKEELSLDKFLDEIKC